MRGLRNGGNYRHQLTCDVMKATLKRMKESHEFEKKMPNGGWEKKRTHCCGEDDDVSQQSRICIRVVAI